MGFLDKLKEGAEQAKELAQQAAEKAKDEAKELQLKRQMNNEFEELGKLVFDLVQRGDVSHADFSAGVQRIVEIKSQLAALEAGDGSSAGTNPPAASPPPPAPPSDAPPAMPS
jgi:hypothetical protein